MVRLIKGLRCVCLLLSKGCLLDSMPKGPKGLTAQELTIHLLNELAEEKERVSLPILKPRWRRRSGLRG